jgi:RNA polymerase sigma factor (sigma-70 family)
VQEIAVLYYVDGMNLDEVAQEMNLSVPTVRKRLKKFIEKAKRMLK